jgi:hypothetical protein
MVIAVEGAHHELVDALKEVYHDDVFAEVMDRQAAVDYQEAKLRMVPSPVVIQLKSLEGKTDTLMELVQTCVLASKDDGGRNVH